jgi:hypothetical protein
MARRKKINTIDSKENNEVKMSPLVSEQLEMTTAIDTTELEAAQAELDSVLIELEQTKLQIEEKKKELQFIDRREIAPVREVETPKVVSTNQILERQKSFDAVLVTGKFINRHRPGQSVKLPYQKWPENPVKWHQLVDGNVYTIPRGFADQINGGTENDPLYYKPTFIQKQGEQLTSDVIGENSAIHHVDTQNKKYAFVPVHF